MSKRKPTFTAETAAQNRAMIDRAKELLKDADPYSVANDHPGVMETIKAEFPGVSEGRIWPKMARALMGLRAKAIQNRAR